MLLGFVSLLLAVLQDEIADICVPERFAKKWIPCHDLKSTNETTTHFQSSISNGGRRLLAEEGGTSSCPKVIYL
ncbi:MLO-like protein 12 [Bienertia sinuspersici]